MIRDNARWSTTKTASSAAASSASGAEAKVGWGATARGQRHHARWLSSAVSGHSQAQVQPPNPPSAVARCEPRLKTRPWRARRLGSR